MTQFRFTTKLIILLSLLMMTLMICGSCMQLARSITAPPAVHTTDAPFKVNINVASAQELEQLPGVGKVIAERIVAYREQYGRFRRPEELLMVNGVSDKKFREIQAMVVVD